mmetsp:Transcript_38501/g.80671  ORF Transcript_38501/g.80671 Transcript_38501/m.80671 type:complete len:201 (+) Transcript_38501:67-669(+)
MHTPSTYKSCRRFQNHLLIFSNIILRYPSRTNRHLITRSIQPARIESLNLNLPIHLPTILRTPALPPHPPQRRHVKPSLVLHPIVHQRGRRNTRSIMSARIINPPHAPVFAEVRLTSAQCGHPRHHAGMLHGAVPFLIPRVVAFDDVKLFVHVPHVQMRIVVILLLVVTRGHHPIVAPVPRNQFLPILAHLQIYLVFLPH